jgi:nicotinamide mononucleotide adenylyltransferase
VAKHPKSPGKPVPFFEDFLRQLIRVGDHVIVGQRDGNHDRMWSAEVFDINAVEIEWWGYNNNRMARVEYKLLVQPTGAYRGSQHVWPVETDTISGESVISGRPRMSWIDAEKAIRSPVRITTVIGTKRPGFLTEPQESA